MNEFLFDYDAGGPDNFIFGGVLDNKNFFVLWDVVEGVFINVGYKLYIIMKKIYRKTIILRNLTFLKNHQNGCLCFNFSINLTKEKIK